MKRVLWPGIFFLIISTLNSCAILELQRARSELTIQEDVAYADDGEPRHRLDVFMPADARRVPVVFFVHGGYWNSQDKTYYRAFTGLYSNIGTALARAGIGTVVTEYRIAPETDIDGELADVTAALRWTQNHIGAYGGDADRLVLAGHSAGGHMVALLGLWPRRLQAAGIRTPLRGLIALSPILSVNGMQASKGQAFNRSTTYPVFGSDPATWQLYSPINYFAPTMLPSLFAFGGQDEAYLLTQADEARERIARLGGQADFLTLPDYRHEDMVLRFGQPEDPLLPAVTAFVRRVTRGRSPD